MNIFDNQNSLLCYNSIHSLFLELEKEWNWVQDVKDAKIIPIMWPEMLEEIKDQISSNHVILWLDIFHSDAGSHCDRYFNDMYDSIKHLTNKFFVVHTNTAYTDSKHIYFDHIFNRQKLYFTEYKNEYFLHNRVYTYDCYKEIYNIPEIIKLDNCKKFLSPMRTYDYKNNPAPPDRMVRRLELRKLLNNYETDGFISDPALGKILFPNSKSSIIENELPDISSHLLKNGGTWYPVGDEYYQRSFISIFVETITLSTKFGTCKIISEKTFDPLIKGHFILPFGYRGLIEDITGFYKFKLPDWIDYRYDSIENENDRFKAYLKSVKKVLEYSVDELMNFYDRDINILIYNQQVFFNRPYDKLYPKVVKFIKDRNW